MMDGKTALRSGSHRTFGEFVAVRSGELHGRQAEVFGFWTERRGKTRRQDVTGWCLRLGKRSVAGTDIRRSGADQAPHGT